MLYVQINRTFVQPYLLGMSFAVLQLVVHVHVGNGRHVIKYRLQRCKWFLHYNCERVVQYARCVWFCRCCGQHIHVSCFDHSSVNTPAIRVKWGNSETNFSLLGQPAHPPHPQVNSTHVTYAVGYSSHSLFSTAQQLLLPN